MFGWNADNRFGLWKNLTLIFAVINSNVSLDVYNLFCCEGKTELNIYEIPKMNGYWKQSHMCFGLDQTGILDRWPSFKIYCSDELPGNQEFVLVEQKMVVPMLMLDRDRCLFVEEEKLLKYNSRYMAIKGNIYVMENANQMLSVTKPHIQVFEED
jgi:hypothetical protein